MYILDTSAFAHRVWARAIAASGRRDDNWAAYQIAVGGKSPGLMRREITPLTDELAQRGMEGSEVRLVAALDIGQSFRHKLYSPYKAQRPPIGECQRAFFDKVPEIMQEMGVELYYAPDFEADDVIGVIAKLSVEAGWEVRIVSNDRDLWQLANSSNISFVCRMKSPQNSKKSVVRRLNADEIQAELGFHPSRLPTYKALVGDKSDNIPGVRGIGVAAATPLVRQYESINEIYSNLDRIGLKSRLLLAEAGKQDFTPQLFEQLCTLDFTARPIRFSPGGDQ
jgi:DNA polymerase-1